MQWNMDEFNAPRDSTLKAQRLLPSVYPSDGGGGKRSFLKYLRSKPWKRRTRSVSSLEKDRFASPVIDAPTDPLRERNGDYIRVLATVLDPQAHYEVLPITPNTTACEVIATLVDKYATYTEDKSPDIFYLTETKESDQGSYSRVLDGSDKVHKIQQRWRDEKNSWFTLCRTPKVDQDDSLLGSPTSPVSILSPTDEDNNYVVLVEEGSGSSPTFSDLMSDSYFSTTASESSRVSPARTNTSRSNTTETSPTSISTGVKLGSDSSENAVDDAVGILVDEMSSRSSLRTTSTSPQMSGCGLIGSHDDCRSPDSLLNSSSYTCSTESMTYSDPFDNSLDIPTDIASPVASNRAGCLIQRHFSSPESYSSPRDTRMAVKKTGARVHFDDQVFSPGTASTNSTASPWHNTNVAMGTETNHIAPHPKRLHFSDSGYPVGPRESEGRGLKLSLLMQKSIDEGMSGMMNRVVNEEKQRRTSWENTEGEPQSRMKYTVVTASLTFREGVVFQPLVCSPVHSEQKKYPRFVSASPAVQEGETGERDEREDGRRVEGETSQGDRGEDRKIVEEEIGQGDSGEDGKRVDGEIGQGDWGEDGKRDEGETGQGDWSEDGKRVEGEIGQGDGGEDGKTDGGQDRGEDGGQFEATGKNSTLDENVNKLEKPAADGVGARKLAPDLSRLAEENAREEHVKEVAKLQTVVEGEGEPSRDVDHEGAEDTHGSEKGGSHSQAYPDTAHSEREEAGPPDQQCSDMVLPYNYHKTSKAIPPVLVESELTIHPIFQTHASLYPSFLHCDNFSSKMDFLHSLSTLMDIKLAQAKPKLSKSGQMFSKEDHLSEIDSQRRKPLVPDHKGSPSLLPPQASLISPACRSRPISQVARAVNPKRPHSFNVRPDHSATHYEPFSLISPARRDRLIQQAILVLRSKYHTCNQHQLAGESHQGLQAGETDDDGEPLPTTNPQVNKGQLRNGRPSNPHFLSLRRPTTDSYNTPHTSTQCHFNQPPSRPSSAAYSDTHECYSKADLTVNLHQTQPSFPDLGGDSSSSITTWSSRSATPTWSHGSVETIATVPSKLLPPHLSNSHNPLTALSRQKSLPSLADHSNPPYTHTQPFQKSLSCLRVLQEVEKAATRKHYSTESASTGLRKNLQVFQSVEMLNTGTQKEILYTFGAQRRPVTVIVSNKATSKSTLSLCNPPSHFQGTMAQGRPQFCSTQHLEAAKLPTTY